MLVPQKESGGQRVSQQQCTVPGTAQVEGAQLHAGSCVQAQPSPTLPRSGPAAGPLTAWSSLYRGLRATPYLGSKGGRRGEEPRVPPRTPSSLTSIPAPPPAGPSPPRSTMGRDQATSTGVRGSLKIQVEQGGQGAPEEDTDDREQGGLQ